MRVVLLSLILGLCQICNAHKFYMSITDIKYNEQANSLEITIKFFTDDLEKALEKESKQRIYLGTEKEIDQINPILKTYLQERFIIKKNEQNLSLIYIGKESESDYTWAYLELKDYNPQEKIWIQNTVLIDLFPEQVNRINFQNNIYTKSVSLHKDMRGAKF